MARYIDTELLEKEAKCLYRINNFEPVKAYTQEQIDNAPTIDVKEVIRGKWISNLKSFDKELYRCSICNTIYGNIKNLHFCPSCGADMWKGDDIDGLLCNN